MTRFFVANGLTGLLVCGPFKDRETAQSWAERYTYTWGIACFVVERKVKGAAK